jgi:predicted cupin superfamily sugar epimerase
MAKQKNEELKVSLEKMKIKKLQLIKKIESGFFKHTSDIFIMKIIN